MILKLLKYEFMRRKNTLAAFCILLAVAEGLILFGLYKGKGWVALSIFLSVIMVAAVYFYGLLDAIGSYFSDLKNKHGYMLFLTPVSGYRIIGAKALFGVIQLFVSAILVFLLMFLNLRISGKLYLSGTQLEQFWIAAKAGLGALVPNLWQIIQFVVITLMQWFNIIMMGIFAITLSKTVFSSSRHRFLLSLLFFILVNMAVQAITITVLAPFGLFGDMIHYEVMDNVMVYGSLNLDKYFTIGIGLYAVYISLFYFLSGRLLHRRIDL